MTRDVEPAVVMSEALWHQRVPDVASHVEPSGRTLNESSLYSFCIWRLLPAGRRLGVPHESRSGNRGFQILCSCRLKFDRFDYIGDSNIPPVLERRLSPQYVGSRSWANENPSVCSIEISNRSPARVRLSRW